jgi:hypothetical protein
MSYQVDSYGNAYFPAGVSVASIPATTGTQARVLVPGVNGRISSATVAQLITQSGGNLVSSVYGRTGAVTAALGDYNTDLVTEGQALYFTTDRARKTFSITTFNTSGPATYDSSTGILNIPQYGSASNGNFVPLTRKISINGQTADLSVDRMFSVEEMVYPPIGIPLSNGTSWGASITNNSANWNTAYSWGNHAGLYSLLGHTHTFASLTSKPTTLAGYGITDAATSAQGTNADTAFGWGNHALVGYLTSFTETDPTVPSHVKAITTTNISNWNTAYTWGNHALAGYLTSFTETDPIWTSEKANYALKTYVDTSISNLIDTAPATLNTLNELAAALGDDANFSTTVTDLIGTKEPAITAGTTAQYWRGDKTWQTLPIYTLNGLGGVPTSRTLTINGTSYDLSADRSWTINSMVYPSAGIAVSTGTAWGTSITDNSANWNSAFTDRFKWDGGATGLVAATGRTSLGLGTAATANTGDFAAASHTHIIANVTGLQTALDGKENAFTKNTAFNKNFGTTADTVTQGNDARLSDARTPTAHTHPISDITGLQTALDGKAASVHTHTIDNVTGLQTALDGKEPSITAGTTAQYWRGDKSWQTLPIYTLAGLGGLPLAGGIMTGAITLKEGAANGLKFPNDIFGGSGDTAGMRLITRSGESMSLEVYLTNDADDWFNISVPNDSAAKVNGNTIWHAGNLINFTRTVSGLVPNPGGSTTNRYLREDGTWVIPPDTDTVYVHPTTAGNKHIPAGGSAGQILRYSSDGTAAWGADNDTTYSVFTRSANGLTPAAPAGTGTTRYLREDGTWQVPPDTDTDTNTTYSNFTRTVSGLVPNPGGSTTNRYLREDGTWVVPPDTDTDTNTWNANTRDVAGYVSAPGAIANKVWKTDASGNPGWRDDADTDTNTTYTAGTGLTLTGTSFSITKTISDIQTADTIALRNGSGQLVATGFFQASSRTLKTNINPFTKSALDIIREVSVVSFNYKTDVINKHIGFIAEDTPEELSTRNKNVMDSNNTIGVLLKAVQELEAKVKELEAKCNEK